ncbi:MAG: response regulator transcription factor [Actinobacteria bacterium]|nr:MAG: response regulator transcription factor [Actinomycetota bacterium]
MSMDEIAVVLVEDDSMVRGWVRLALQESEFRLAGEASSAAETPELLQRRAAQVLLVDYRLPDGFGTELVRSLRQSGVDTPAILMTANAERGFNEAVRECGAQGTVLKTGRVEELLETLRAVLDGVRAFDERHPKRAPGRAALSPREREVLGLVARGATNREIASALAVGDETVKTLIARTFVKLGVKRRAEAVSTAHSLGLL